MAAGNGGQKMSQYSWFTVYHETPSLKSVAKTSNVSATTVCRILDSIHYSCPPLKEAVSIN